MERLTDATQGKTPACVGFLLFWGSTPCPDSVEYSAQSLETTGNWPFS